MLQARGTDHVDAPMDGRDPGRAGERMDDSRGAEDREAAFDPEPGIPRPLGELDAVGDRDRDLRICRRARLCRDLGDCRLHHLARHRVDRGLAGRDRQARSRHHADTRSGTEPDATPRRQSTHRREHQGQMRHIGIVARVLDDAGRRRLAAPLAPGEGKARPLALGQRNLDGIGKIAGQQRLKCRLSRRGRAGTGGPAAAQRPARLDLSFGVVFALISHDVIVGIGVQN